jgi:hypothetical protein
MNRLARVAVLGVIGAVLAGCGGSGSGGGGVMPPPGVPDPSNTPLWAQWGGNPQHTGMVSVAGQSLLNKDADIVYDPFIAQEKAENVPIFGEAVLTVHEQAPITDGNDVYMVAKTGTYTSCNPAGAWSPNVQFPVAQCGPNTWNTMVWNEVRYTWESGVLTQIWTYASDWKPEPNGFGLGGWEPVFHPLDANGFIYVPGAGGTVWKVDKKKGTATSHINPFTGANGVVAANTFVAGPLTADAQGNIYYNVIQLADPTLGDPWTDNDVVNAWLVQVGASDTAKTATFASLITAAPAGSATTCPGTWFALNDGGASLPWPPANVIGTNQTPPTQACGSQRPGINIAPAVAPDGTIYTASRAHFDSNQAYLVSVNPQSMSANWASSMQNLLTDGCGSLVPFGPTATVISNYCRVGATPGVDPTTNAMGSASIPDQASTAPTVLPDGSVLYGALDNYNYSRGHLFHFDATGKFLNSFTFGWDDTPAVYAHGGTFSIVTKDNHYQASSYCGFNNDACRPRGVGPYYITQLDANLNIEWQFQSTTMDADHPNGYEWCINMPAVDMNGNVYVNSEDGNIYELAQGNAGIFTQPTGKMFLNLALGAAYTPVSIGADGKIYTQNNGHFFVVGN